MSSFRARALSMSAAAALALGLVSAAVPAQAAVVPDASCTVSVALPPKLVISSWNSIITAKLSDPTSCAAYASWTLVRGTAGAGASASFSNPNTVDRMSFYTGPSGSHSGTYKAVGSSAYSDDTYVGSEGFERTVTVVQADSSPLVAKYASKLTWLSASRAGSTVTLAAKASRYSPFKSFGGYVTWSSAKVLLQKRVGDTWRTVKTVRTNAKGIATARVSGTQSTWRLVTEDSASVWGTATSSKRR